MKANLEEKKEIFGKYDIRGVYPDQLDDELAREIAEGLGKELFKKGVVVVGMDARKSSPSLYKNVIAGLELAGTKVLRAGLVTTPMIYFLVSDLGLDGGMVVTASHDPGEYNGLKVVGKGSELISGVDILKIIQ